MNAVRVPLDHDACRRMNGAVKKPLPDCGFINPKGPQTHNLKSNWSQEINRAIKFSYSQEQVRRHGFLFLLIHS